MSLIKANAKVEFFPVMTPEDLGKAGPSIAAAVEKWGSKGVERARHPSRIIRNDRQARSAEVNFWKPRCIFQLAACAADAHGKEFRNELSNRVDKLRER